MKPNLSTVPPVRITFESVLPVQTPTGPMPCIAVGAIGPNRSWTVARLFLHVGVKATPDGIEPGKWFVLPMTTNPKEEKLIMGIRPVCGTLEEMKAAVTAALSV